MIRVLIAEASATDRMTLNVAIAPDAGISVVATAATGEEVLSRCRALRPDLVVVDLNLPGIGGLEVTRRLMAENPVPIIVVTDDATTQSIEVLRAGALALLRRPHDGGAELRSMVRALTDVKLVRRRQPESERSPAAPSPRPRRIEIVAIAASAGGPGALARLFTDFPSLPAVPFAVVQHNTIGFMTAFASWLQTVSGKSVVIARDGEVLRPGVIHLAPDDRHLGVSAAGQAKLSQTAPIGGFRPSANALFESAAVAYGAHALGVILTGMGSDGATGLRKLHDRGARVIAQDEASSVVFGMPGAAIAAGACDEVLTLGSIAARITALTDHR